MKPQPKFSAGQVVALAVAMPKRRSGKLVTLPAGYQVEVVEVADHGGIFEYTGRDANGDRYGRLVEEYLEAVVAVEAAEPEAVGSTGRGGLFD